jgi:hypothetical protein
MNDITQVLATALNIKYLQQQALVSQIAGYQTGGQWIEKTDFNAMLASLQDPQQAQQLQQQLDMGPAGIGAYQHWQFSETSLDALVAESSIAAGQFQKLADGLNRQLGLMSIVLGSKG